MDVDGEERMDGRRGRRRRRTSMSKEHLSTTKPCSPGEKTRQPCTHLVSSGPSIRRRGSLLLFVLMAVSLSLSAFLLSFRVSYLIIVTIRSRWLSATAVN